MDADIQRAASGMQVAAMAPPPTRADYYGYPDRTQRMGPQTMMGGAQTAVSPYQQTGYGGYDGGDNEPRRSWARRWLPWLIPLLAVIAAIAVAAVMLTSNNGKSAFVPQVYGETQAQAVTQIKAAGLNPVVVQQSSATVQKGLVITTSPAQGNSVNKGSTVTVYVSSGAANVQVPNVNGLQQAAAHQKLASVGLNNVSLQSDPQSTVPQGQVDHTSPAGGTSVDPNTQITIYVSGGGVQVQSLIGDTAVQAQQILQGHGFTVKTFYTAGPQPVAPGTVWSQNPAGQTTEPTHRRSRSSCSRRRRPARRPAPRPPRPTRPPRPPQRRRHPPAVPPPPRRRR